MSREMADPVNLRNRGSITPSVVSRKQKSSPLAVLILGAFLLPPTSECRPPRGGYSSRSVLSTRLRLITLDLDGTLWPTAPVVASANRALCTALRSMYGVEAATPSELQLAMKRLRPRLEVPDRLSLLPRPVTYTELRIAAIADLLGNKPGTDVRARELFDVWLAARHAAAEELLFQGATSALTKVREAFPNAVVAAVTNGRGDPRAMASIARYFDLTVSGEDPDVHPRRKPSPVIYRTALARAGIAAADLDSTGWVHIGDDLLNDVAAAKAVGAKTVWLDLNRKAAVAESAPALEIVSGGMAQCSERAAVAAAVEEGSYSTLADSIRKARTAQRSAVPASAIDARISAIADLPEALLEIAALVGRE